MKNINPNIRMTMNRFYKKIITYSYMVIFLAFSILIGMLSLRIGEYSRREPTGAQLKEKISNRDSKSIDQEALNKLKELRERNVSIESLFDNGRTNPFEN